KLLVLIPCPPAFPSRYAVDRGHVAVQETSGTDTEDRMVMDHPHRHAPEDDTISGRCRLRRLIDGLHVVQRLPDAIAHIRARCQHEADADQRPEAAHRLPTLRSPHPHTDTPTHPH